MNYKKQIGKNTVALLLFTALMLPAAIQFFHVFEGHEHTACNEQTTHIHKLISKCEICHFQLASFNYDIVKYSGLLLPKIIVEIANSVPLQVHSPKINNTQLRAPPIYS